MIANVFASIMNFVFGESLPPERANGVNGNNGDWGDRSHNKTAKRQLPGSKVDLIRLADERSRQRYNEMDESINKLHKMASASRQRKAQLKAQKTGA